MDYEPIMGIATGMNRVFHVAENLEALTLPNTDKELIGRYYSKDKYEKGKEFFIKKQAFKNHFKRM